MSLLSDLRKFFSNAFSKLFERDHRAPAQTRPLTKIEKEKLGFSPKSRRYVRADLKRVTKSTKIFSERDVFKARHEGQSKEAYQKAHKENLANGRVMFKNLTPDQAKKIARRYPDREMHLRFFYEHAGYGNFGEPKSGGWASTTSLIDPGQAPKFIDRLLSERGLFGKSVFGQSRQEFTLVVNKKK